MDPKVELHNITTEARNLAAKASDTSQAWTAADETRVHEIVARQKELLAIVDRREKAAKSLVGFGGTGGERTNDDNQPGTAKAGFTGNVMKAFEDQAGTVGGPFAAKALVPSGSVVAAFDQSIVMDPVADMSILSQVDHARIDGANQVSFLAQTEATQNAATIINGEMKPISMYGLEEKTMRLATVAHLAGPYQRQWFADHKNLQQFLEVQLTQGLRMAMSELLLNGGKDEKGGNIPGILTSTGVGHTYFVTSKLATIRRAITQLQTIGATPTSVTLNPSTWEEIESVLATDQAIYSQGLPQETITPKLYGLPVFLDVSLSETQAIIGDLKAVRVYDPAQLSLSWSEQGTFNTGTAADPVHVDLFRENKVVFRGEIRTGVSVLSPKHLRVVDLVAPDAWAGSTAYEVGDVVKLAGGEYLKATVAGTSGGTEPAAPGVIGGTVADGTVTWQRIQ